MAEKRKWSPGEVRQWMEQHGTHSFYFNKEDANVIVRKRNIGLGWTVNWANPLSYVLQAGILLFVFLTISLVN